MNIGMLTAGVLWLIPFILGSIICVWGGCIYLVPHTRFNWTRQRRIHYLWMGRSVIPVLPLSGILGTVWGLMDTLLFMGDKSAGALEMTDVVGKFAVALNTTFWGVIFSLVAIFIYEIQISQMEAVDESPEK